MLVWGPGLDHATAPLLGRPDVDERGTLPLNPAIKLPTSAVDKLDMLALDPGATDICTPCTLPLGFVPEYHPGDDWSGAEVMLPAAAAPSASCRACIASLREMTSLLNVKFSACAFSRVLLQACGSMQQWHCSCNHAFISTYTMSGLATAYMQRHKYTCRPCCAISGLKDTRGVCPTASCSVQ